MNEREKLNDKLMGEIGAMSDEEFAQGMQRIHDLMRGRSAKVRERELLLEQARALVEKYKVKEFRNSKGELLAIGTDCIEPIEEGRRTELCLKAAVLLAKLVAALEEE